MSRLSMIFVLLLNLAAGSTLAQTVDPCQYGCPKEGCPQCDEGGGPIEDDGPDESSDEDGSEDEDSGEDDSGDLPA